MTSVVNRYYDSTTGAFVSVDPDVGITGQPYAYAGDDPINEVDPSGDLGCGFLWLGNCSPKSSVQPFTCAPSGTALTSYNSNQISCDSGPIAPGAIGNSQASGSSSASSQWTAAQARAAAEYSGYQIPDDYVAERAANDQGWVFRVPGSTGNADIVRVGEPNPQNPSGYVRFYNNYGQPLTADGEPGPDSDTHLPLGDDDGDAEPLAAYSSSQCNMVLMA